MDVVDIADARRARQRADDERQRADDERHMRRALKDADERTDKILSPFGYNAADRARLGALAVIYDAMVQAALVDQCLPGIVRPKSARSYWVDHTHEREERIEAAKQRLAEIREINENGGDVRLLFHISASSSDVDNAEAVLRVAHRAICVPGDDKQVPKGSLRDWRVLMALAGGKSPEATAKRFKISSDREISRIKLRALGKVLTGVRHLLPPAKANLPKKAKANLAKKSAA